ncbi:glycosyltransferase [bacterium]|nr:glycosyltransferase [bacterium]
MSLPRVLVYGQPFNRSHGGGITLSNLFTGWDKKSIAVAAMGHLMYNITTDICNNYYQLGNEEFRWKFPFYLLQRRFSSGVLDVKESKSSPLSPTKSGLRSLLVNRVFYPALEWIGVFHSAKVLKMSERFQKWLSDFQPEVLYMQVSTRETVLFATALTDYLNIPSVIHFMDDWPSTLSSMGLLKSHWRKRIDRELKVLLDKVDVHLSISEAMAAEYRTRYNKMFSPFHNPIVISKYLSKPKIRVINGVFRILYLGRIGTANMVSIKSFSFTISKLEFKEIKVTLDVYTPDSNTAGSLALAKLRNVSIQPPIANELVPDLLTEFDLLLLPLDFAEKGLKYARFSIPTKLSEYMISGTPILVYSPKESAVSIFCQMHECALCVNDESEDALAEAILFLISNAEYREKISENAVRVATDLFDADVVRPRFHDMLSRLASSKSPVPE